jgi:hypothetical protein
VTAREPTEVDIKRLLRGKKPAFLAEGTADSSCGATFKVVYDGRDSWVIERPARMEFKAGTRTIFVQPDSVEIIDIPVAANNDVKSALDGRRIAYLDDATFKVTGWAVVARRPCIEVRAIGLRQGEDVAFEMAIDTETGAALRISRDGMVLFEVTEFRLAEPPPDA